MKRRFILPALFAVGALLLTGGCVSDFRDTATGAKPVIYLYPEETSEVSVTLDYAGELTCTYPAYADGWQVTAEPDGTLTDEAGNRYNYLFWEGESSTVWDFSKGFCVKGEDTAEFLRQTLAEIGLTDREANEMIVYWLPKMQNNPYNLIAFQNEVYEQTAALTIKPEPDSLLRVFMAWKPMDRAVEIERQEFMPFVREGFTAVEWGGCEIK